MNVKLGNYDIFVKIVYKNNKNIYFRFNNDLNLIVTCPKRTFDEEIYKLIEKNSDSLIKMYEKMLNRKKFDDEFWYLGKKYNLVYDENLDETNINGEYIYTKDEKSLASFINSEIERIYKSEADICERCFVGLPNYTLKFRKMKTRWGVCNRTNNTVTLNTELIKRDVKLLDYVIIHEFAHFYEGNHSKKFWDIVSVACPKYKEYRKELRK